MPPMRLIRIEHVRYDALADRHEGMAVRRAASGALSRQPVSADGHPDWTYGDAVRALEARAGA